MGQRQRFDMPGRVHHVMNRGVGKRVIFADACDYRRFVTLMACAVRRGEIQIIAYSLMANHFHLLVRSEKATLSKAMRRIQNDYVRWFNRKYRRDGPLLRGRFKSRPVDSFAYFITLIWYIDHNAVSARICRRPAQFPWGSAQFYVFNNVPPWLYTSPVRDALQEFIGRAETNPKAYVRVFSESVLPHAKTIVEALHRSRRSMERHLDNLLRARPERVVTWMRAKARNADGLRPWILLAAPAAIQAAVGELCATRSIQVNTSNKPINPWPVLSAGLMYLIGGEPQGRIADRLGIAVSTVSKYVRVHRSMLINEPAYAAVAAEVASRAANLTFNNREVL